MMKVCLLFPTLCVFTSIPTSNLPIYRTNKINYVYIPPLSTKKDNPIYISFSLRMRYEYSFFLDYQYNENMDYESVDYEEGNASDRDIISYFPGEMVIGDGTTFRITIKIKDGNNSEIVGFYETSKTQPSNISLSANFSETYQTKTNITHFESSDDVVNHYPETFTFNNFQESQSQLYYNYLNLHAFSMKYDCHFDFDMTYKECYLYLQNVENWFSNIGSPYGNYQKLLLEIIKQGDEYHFQLKDPLYVHKTTNKLYSTYHEDCFLTKRIYLPKNGFKNQTIQANLSIKGVGFNESNISQTFIFSTTRNYLGNCYNSEYCISGVPSNPEFEFGEVEEH